MNTQSRQPAPARNQPAAPAPAPGCCATSVQRAAMTGHVETCLAHVTNREAAFGCVDWFIYPQAPRQPGDESPI